MAGSGGVTVNSGTLRLPAGVSLDKPLTLNSGAIVEGDDIGNANLLGTTTIGMNANVSLMGDLTLVAPPTISLAARGATVQISDGAAHIILPFANNYAGGWVVNDGTLHIQNASVLGTGTSAVIVNDGALIINGVTLNRGVTLNDGAVLSGYGTVNGDVNVASGSAVTLGGARLHARGRPQWRRRWFHDRCSNEQYRSSEPE